MLFSMTGHGSAVEDSPCASVIADVRTINSRYLKIVVRCSEGYSSLEPRLEEVVRSRVRRGTVQVQLQIRRQSGADDYLIDEAVLKAYQRQLHRLDLVASTDALLALPGVVVEQAEGSDADEEWEQVHRVLLAALDRLQAMREDEGRAMAADLHDNLRQIAAELEQISLRAPQVAATYGGRLLERINLLLEHHGVQVEPASVVREVGVFAERTDISEELVRLRSHLEQFASFVDSSDSNGRKLDFLVQEMFREVNTIGSKANDVEIATRVVAIKSCIERMREMIQNIE